jgi:hypothetical protein
LTGVRCRNVPHRWSSSSPQTAELSFGADTTPDDPVALLPLLRAGKTRVIPSVPGRKEPRPYDLFCARHLIENFFSYLIVRVRRQYLENSFPNAALRPTTMTCVHLLPIAEPLRQIPPRNARPIAVEDRLDEQPIILGGRPNMAFTAWKQVFNPFPLVIMQAVTMQRSAPESADPLGIIGIPTWESPN